MIAWIRKLAGRLALYVPLAVLAAGAWAILGLLEDYGSGDAVGIHETYTPERVELLTKRLRGLEPVTVTLPVVTWQPRGKARHAYDAWKSARRPEGQPEDDRAPAGQGNEVTGTANAVTNEATAVERRFSLDLDLEHLLGVWPIPKAPHGGEVAVTLPAGGGQAEVVFRRSKPPLFSLGGERFVGAGLVQTGSGSGLGAAGYADLFRVRDRWALRLVGGTAAAGGETDWQLGAYFGAAW